MTGLAALLAAALLAQGPQGDRALEDVRILAADDMQGRAPGTPGSARAKAYILQRFAEIGVEPAVPGFEQTFSYTARGRQGSGVNLLGRIEGTEAGGPVLLVMAHYDHEGVVRGEIYNGADDNASGVAGLLAVAEAFRTRPPRHTILLAVVDAEEVGLRGSRHLADHMPIPLARLGLVLNFDMLSKSNRGELYVAGTSHHPALKPRVAALAAKAPVKLLVGHDTPAAGPSQDWTAESDHAAFHAKRVPWLYFGVEDHPEYHKPTDDFATIPAPFFRGSVATVVMAAQALEADLDAIARGAGR